MPNFRRNFVKGGTFFFTVVTYRRHPVFADPHAVELLRQSVRETRHHLPFDIVASVVLPDHLHMIWALPAGDCRFDHRWSSIKQNFTRRWITQGHKDQAVTSAESSESRRGVWQPRFIEHTTRDEFDLRHHVDYIHFNPVKHGYADRPSDWPYSSSTHGSVKDGSPATGVGCNPT